MNMKNNKGFSLVELIVVIAIMAILAAVAVIGVSVYIPKAQKAADQQAITDIMDAFTMYYYSDPEGVTGGYVVLGPDGVVVDKETGKLKVDTFGEAAMKALYGEDWATAVKLQHADWQGVTSTLSYKESSYFGKESELIGTVDKLTGALGDVIEEQASFGNMLIGDEFDKFLKDNKVNANDGKAVGNAAVLYVADKTQGNEDAIKNAFADGIAVSNGNVGAVVNNVYANLYNTGIGDAASLAAIYAYAEGFAQATGKADAFHENTDFSSVTDASSALEALGKAFSVLDPNDFADYAAKQGNKDLQGYIDMMGTVHDNNNIVSSNLNSHDCFTDGTVENLLTGHAAMSNLAITTNPGEVAIILTIDENGTPAVHVAPLNWNK